MKPLKLFLTIVFGAFLSYCAFSQIIDSTYNNYYFYTAQMDPYFDSLVAITPDTIKIEGLKNYERWKDFWRTKVYSANDSIQGGFENYTINMALYKDNPNLLPTDNDDYSWEFVGPDELPSHNMGIIVSLYVNTSNINHVYAGTNASGLFRTLDGGLNWENITDNCLQHGLGVLDLAVDPQDEEVIYISTGNDRNNYGTGIYKTANGGLSWQHVLSFNPDELKKGRKIIVDPTDADVVYALVDQYVYRTMDGGDNWEIIFDDLTWDPACWDKDKYLIDIEIRPGDPNTIYVSSSGISTCQSHIQSAELWYTNNAKSPEPQIVWSKYEDGLPDFLKFMTIETDPIHANILYIAYSIYISQSESHLYLKKLTFSPLNLQSVFDTTATNSYSKRFGGFGQSMRDLEVSPSNSSLLFFGGYNLTIFDLDSNRSVYFHHVSSNSNPYFHVDQRSYETINYDGNTYLFCGNDGGVSRFTWETKTMESLNGSGLNNLQFYGIANSEITPKYYIGGTQDNGMIGNGPGYWYRSNVGDGYEAIIDPVAPNIVYCTSNGGTRDVYKSSDYGQTFNGCYNGISYSTRKNYGLNDRPFFMSPNDHNTLYVCYNEVYKTTNGGNNWSAISNIFSTYSGEVPGAISGFGVSASDENTIYVGYDGPTWDHPNQRRFFKTTDGGTNWTDLTSQISNIVAWAGITNIVVSPDDANNVWISFGGFWDDENGNAVNRVIYSSDGGTNWTDISYNLPVLPVNCLAGINFDDNFNVLLGNDLGIFLFNEQNESWEDISNGLPPCIVSDIEVNYSDGELSIATFGRGIWKSNIPCTNGNNDIIITQNETWNSDRILFDDVIIESGATLEIQSKVFANDGVTIIIKRGAELLLNGGLLTSNCEMWNGIEVWGTTTASQSTSGAQGKVMIENGGTIENAITAVFLSKSNGSGGYIGGYEGGIIQTHDAHFINNRTGVRFFPYRNLVSGVEMDNLSYFHKSEFLTDAELADESIPENFLYLDGVKGINVNGCSFTNSRPEEEASVSERGIGIYSYDADFTVSWYPGEDPDSSKFTNLNYGIHATDATTARTFKVNHSGFFNNLTGIYCKGINNSDIIFNNFEVYYISIFHGPNDIFGGLYLDNCTGYTVEENNFYNEDEYPFPDEILSIGIIVNNSEDNLNMIYRNTFDRLHMGILAQNRNRGTSNFTGLKLKCNICTDNRGDFAVTADTASANKGISIHQGAYIPGDKTAPAGNLFSHANNNNPYSDFNNTLSRQWIYYFHHDSLSPQDAWIPFYHQNITHYGYIRYTTYDDVCPTHYSLGDGHKKSAPIVLNEQELRTRLTLMENLRDSSSNALSLWIDAGNTQQLNYEVESSTEPEALDIYDELMQDSPYLSDTVLSSSIAKENVLVNAMIRDIMVANPHGVKKEALVEALEQRVPPVPDYMMEEIME
ncbi:MAG: hypothetical protein WC599_10505, partial [Bacteroidales bacterium]